jgi:hypothetical protein
VLDVAQTINIGKEMAFSIRAIAKGHSNAKVTDDIIDAKYKSRSHLYKKYRDIATHIPILFYVIAIEKDKNKRLLIEAQYAHDTKAQFWNPEPGQTI